MPDDELSLFGRVSELIGKQQNYSCMWNCFSISPGGRMEMVRRGVVHSEAVKAEELTTRHLLWSQKEVMAVLSESLHSAFWSRTHITALNGPRIVLFHQWITYWRNLVHFPSLTRNKKCSKDFGQGQINILYLLAECKQSVSFPQFCPLSWWCVTSHRSGVRRLRDTFRQIKTLFVICTCYASFDWSQYSPQSKRSVYIYGNRKHQSLVHSDLPAWGESLLFLKWYSCIYIPLVRPPIKRIKTIGWDGFRFLANFKIKACW